MVLALRRLLAPTLLLLEQLHQTSMWRIECLRNRSPANRVQLLRVKFVKILGTSAEANGPSDEAPELRTEPWQTAHPHLVGQSRPGAVAAPWGASARGVLDVEKAFPMLIGRRVEGHRHGHRRPIVGR